MEIQRMWDLKCKILPVIAGATEILTKIYWKIWKPYQATADSCTRNITYKKWEVLRSET